MTERRRSNCTSSSTWKTIFSEETFPLLLPLQPFPSSRPIITWASNFLWAPLHSYSTRRSALGAAVYGVFFLPVYLEGGEKSWKMSWRLVVVVYGKINHVASGKRREKSWQKVRAMLEYSTPRNYTCPWCTLLCSVVLLRWLMVEDIIFLSILYGETSPSSWREARVEDFYFTRN